MSTRPNLPNVIALQEQFNQLELSHTNLKQEYELHLKLGYLTGIVFFLSMIIVNTLVIYLVSK